MDAKTLTFPPEHALGRVFRVDTAAVWGEALDHDRLSRTTVGSLVAFQGSNSSEFLVGILDRVTRDLSDSADDFGDGDEIIAQSGASRDLFRVVLLGTYRQVDGEKHNTFKRGADSYPLVDASAWVIDGANLQGLMGLLAQDVPSERQLQLGTFVADRSARAIADGDRFFQRHAALLGSTGSGKSWTVALILERAHALKSPNLVVLDMHGEYAPLAAHNPPVGVGFRVAAPGDDPSDDRTLYLPWWLLNQEEMQALLLDRSEENAPNQAARLAHHVRALKLEYLAEKGFDDLAERFTVDSPIPFSIHELLERLDADDTEMVPGANNREKQGPFFGRLTRFVARLRARVEDRRFSFMFAPPAAASQYEWLHDFARKMLGSKPGIKIVDFSEVPSDVLPIVVGLYARVLYEIQFWSDNGSRAPVTIVCDEAHLYLPAGMPDAGELRALDAFERIAKEGRKYGVSLLVVSQRPADLSRTVLSQCNNFIVLRLSNDQDQSVIRRLMPESLESVSSSLPLLDVGEAIVLGDSMVLPTRIRLDVPTIKPASATRRFWTEWSENEPDDARLDEAVESMRRQSRR